MAIVMFTGFLMWAGLSWFVAACLGRLPRRPPADRRMPSRQQSVADAAQRWLRDREMPFRQESVADAAQRWLQDRES